MKNVCVLIGRLTKDPEAKEINGKIVTNFTLAVDRDFAKDKTDFFNCEIWGKSAENLGTFGNKGDLMAVIGRVLIDSYEKDGKRQYITKISVDNYSKLMSSSKNTKVEDPALDNGGFSMDEIPF